MLCDGLSPKLCFSATWRVRETRFGTYTARRGPWLLAFCPVGHQGSLRMCLYADGAAISKPRLGESPLTKVSYSYKG